MKHRKKDIQRAKPSIRIAAFAHTVILRKAVTHMEKDLAAFFILGDFVVNKIPSVVGV
jgi:hypothetical protein